MNDASDENTSAEHVRRMIEAAHREAAKLGDVPKPSKPPADAVPGYEILAEIGRGGMGVVYKALQLSTKRIVALKIMLAGWFASRPARKRFQREVELAARFQHSGIVRLLESGQTSTGQQYYAMDYVEGLHLDRWIQTSQPDVRATLRLFTELCEAVDHAHENGVVHRDLKPANVLIDADGKPHVLDFGLSKATDQADAKDALSMVTSMPGEIMGTLRYLSPEQAEGMPNKVDVRTDVYALGVMLFEALTGAFPFDRAASQSEVMRRIREDPPTPPSSLSDRVDRELETIIFKALEKEKSRRYQSAKELAQDLERYLRNEPILAQPLSSFYVLRKKLVKQRVRIAVAALALALGLIGLWGGTWWRDRSLAQQRERARANARQGALAILCRLEEGTGRTQDLLAKAQAICTEYPGLAEADLVWAQVRCRVARQRRDWSIAGQAVALLEAKLERGHLGWAYRALLVEIYDGSGNPRAEQLRREGEQEIPDTANAWYIRSLATLDTRKALDSAEQAVKHDRAHRLAWRRLASLYLQTGDTDCALGAAEALIDLGDNPTQCLRFQGGALIRHKEYEKAIQRYTLAIEREPNWRCYRERAFSHLCLKEYDEAIADYTKAARLHGADEVWELYHQATPLWITGQTEKAVEDYRVFREWRGYPTCADARLFLILHEQGHPEEADRILAAAHSIVRDKWLGHILTCLACEITPEALVTIAESEDPPNQEWLCEAYYYAGEACLLSARTDDARKWFEQCVHTGLAFDPDGDFMDPMNEYHLARWRLAQLTADTDGTNGPGEG